MPFLDLTPRRHRRRTIDHLLILGALAASLVIIRLADDELIGKAEVADAAGFTIFFVVIAYFLAWLPAIWTGTRDATRDGLVTSLFIGLTLEYFYLGFRSYFIQPGATGPMILLQVLALICLSCRAAISA